MSQSETPAGSKITIVASKVVNQTINRLFEQRGELVWLLAIGRDREGDVYFYDTGGDIVEDIGVLEYVKQTLRRSGSPTR